MSYAIEMLAKLREAHVAEVAEANRKIAEAHSRIADIDAALTSLGSPTVVEGRSAFVAPIQDDGAPELLYQPAQPPMSYDHVHWAVQQSGGEAPAPGLFDNGGEIPSPFPPAPVQAGVAMTTEEIQEARAREARERQGLPEPGPANPPSSAPLTAQENAQPRPWEQQAAEDAAPPAPAEPKKGGRRTNEEIAADHGVKLEDVKAWLGSEGGRVTAGKIKEFAELHPGAVALPGGAEQPTLTEPPAAPEEAAPPPESDWEDADTAPVVGAPSSGDWDPFAGTGPETETPPF